MAPMVAASDYAFRCLCRNQGSQLCYSQMLHARHLVQEHSFRKNHLDLYEYQPLPETLHPAQQHCLGDCEKLLEPPSDQHTKGPLMVQLAGHNPDLVVQAAELVVANSNQQVTGIDFNCGCPQGIARKGKYGAFLMEDSPETVYEILTELRQTLPSNILVSAKIRLPLDPSQQMERVQRLCETGINFLTVHARTLRENKTKVSGIQLDRLKSAVQEASSHDVPVIANGGIEDYRDIEKLLQESNAVGVMSSEGLLERPNIFFAERPRISGTPVSGTIAFCPHLPRLVPVRSSPAGCVGKSSWILQSRPWSLVQISVSVFARTHGFARHVGQQQADKPFTSSVPID